jgi:hypothetical protein
MLNIRNTKKISFCSDESDLRLLHNDLAEPYGYHNLTLMRAVARFSEKSVILAF